MASGNEQKPARVPLFKTVVAGCQKWAISTDEAMAVGGAEPPITVEFGPLLSESVRRLSRNPSIYFTHFRQLRSGTLAYVFQTGLGETSCPLVVFSRMNPRNNDSIKVAIDERLGWLYVAYAVHPAEKGAKNTLAVLKYSLSVAEGKPGARRGVSPKMFKAFGGTKVNHLEYKMDDFSEIGGLVKLLIHPTTGDLLLVTESQLAINGLIKNKIFQLKFDEKKRRISTLPAYLPELYHFGSQLAGNWAFLEKGTRMVALYRNYAKQTSSTDSSTPSVVLWNFHPTGPLSKVLFFRGAHKIELRKPIRSAMLAKIEQTDKEGFGKFFDFLWRQITSYGSFGKYLIFGTPCGWDAWNNAIFAVRTSGRFSKRQTAAETIDVESAIEEIVGANGLKTDKYNVKYMWLLPGGYMGVFVEARNKRTGKISTYLMRISLRQALPRRKRCVACGKKDLDSAKLKACSICKQRNFHRCWWKYACHFCSVDCLTANWSTHKQLHKLPQLKLKQNLRGPDEKAFDFAYAKTDLTMSVGEGDEDECEDEMSFALDEHTMENLVNIMRHGLVSLSK